MGIGGASGRFNCLLRCLRLGETEIFRHRAIKKIGILGDDCDMPPQETQGQVAQVPTAEQNTPLLWIKEAEHQ